MNYPKVTRAIPLVFSEIIKNDERQDALRPLRVIQFAPMKELILDRRNLNKGAEKLLRHNTNKGATA